jgi:hypothetical protein
VPPFARASSKLVFSNPQAGICGNFRAVEKQMPGAMLRAYQLLADGLGMAWAIRTRVSAAARKAD